MESIAEDIPRFKSNYNVSFAVLKRCGGNGDDDDG